MISNWITFKDVLIIAFSSLILYFVAKFIFIPWRAVNSYKKEGVTTSFFPILGFFHLFDKAVKEKGDFMADSKASSKLISNQKYMVSNFTSHPVIFLRDPQYLREFLQKPIIYEKTDFLSFFQPLVGNGLVFVEGETWKRHRKIISSSFHYEFLKTNINVVQETTKEFFDKLSPQEYTNFSVISIIQEITGEIVGKIFFGKSFNKYSFNGKPMTVELAEIISELGMSGRSPLIMLFGHRIMELPLFPQWNKLIKRIKGFRQVCFNIILDRKASGNQTNDFLASLLATQKSEDAEHRYSDEDIINEFITFFVAGMDTTGHLIGMSIYNLTQYPEYLQELKEERDSTYNKEEKITAETLSKMDMMHSLFKETLRFYPPGPFNFFRKALQDHKILDLAIKKGDYITTDYTAVFFDEKHFQNPEKFDPSRWRSSDQKLDPYAFTPFSAGPRNCIGQHLAIMEAKVITSELLERFDFKLKEGYKLRMTFRFLYEPLDELLVSLFPHKLIKSQ